MTLFQSHFHNVIESVTNFDHEWEENAEYAIMEVMPYGFTGNVSFFLSLCPFTIYKIHIQIFSKCNEQYEEH